MPNKSNMTISTKMNKEFVEYMKEKARSEGKSLGELVREALKGERKAYETEKIEGKIVEICFLNDMTPEGVLSALESLLNSGKLFLKGGKICWNQNKRNSEYVSIDDEIERLGLNEKEESRMREKILDYIRVMTGNDYIGNGAGL